MLFGARAVPPTSIPRPQLGISAFEHVRILFQNSATVNWPIKNGDHGGKHVGVTHIDECHPWAAFPGMAALGEKRSLRIFYRRELRGFRSASTSDVV